MNVHPARLVKRFIDVTIAISGVIVLFPMFVGLVLAICYTSPGPAFFLQERVGKGERPFRIIKFRTMVADAPQRIAEFEAFNELDGAIFGMRNDPRVTRIGRFLRRTSMDELPQLLNVLKGEMSLVGPRPLPWRDHERLRESDKIRYRAKPGMSGLAQVSGRNDLGFAGMMECDAKYVLHWSVWLDLIIIFKTPGVVIAGKGAF